MKVQTAFRFDKDLLDELKEKAKAQRRSLNNYIEFLLFQSVGNIPNEETRNAVEEARNKELETIDNLDTFLEEI